MQRKFDALGSAPVQVAAGSYHTAQARLKQAPAGGRLLALSTGRGAIVSHTLRSACATGRPSQLFQHPWLTHVAKLYMRQEVVVQMQTRLSSSAGFELFVRAAVPFCFSSSFLLISLLYRLVDGQPLCAAELDVYW